MRLFGKIDNAINRFDRAWLLSIPFDLAFTQAITYVADTGVRIPAAVDGVRLPAAVDGVRLPVEGF